MRWSDSARYVLRKQGKVLLALLLLLWGLELIDTLLLGQSLNRFGIQPRSLTGLRGVLFAPLLHNGLGHLAANTIPLMVLAWLTMVPRLKDFWWATLLATLVGGLGTWLTGSSGSLHLGSSILIFGYLGFILGRAYYERSLSALFVALIAVALYGGALWGLLPGRIGISWQGHLFGFIGGVLCAAMLGRQHHRLRQRSD